MCIETVDTAEVSVNPITAKQKEDIAKMRASLLSCTDDSGVPIARAVQSITVMRIYHQLTRIIRYTELMDKLEAKLYESIEYQLNNADVGDIQTLTLLIGIQEKLQKSMIESHKLLQPYLDIQNFTIVDLVDSSANVTDSPITAKLMTSESRDKVRFTAQAVLDAIGDVV